MLHRTVYSADYVNQIFDHARDAIVLIPVFAFEVEARARIEPGPDFLGYEWCERDEATARLLWAGQRWSVRHIDDVIGSRRAGGRVLPHPLGSRRKRRDYNHPEPCVLCWPGLLRSGNA